MNRFYRDIAETVLKGVSLEPLRGKRVLITGSNGLIGSHMVAAIHLGNLKQGLAAKVIGISRSAPTPWLESLSADGSVEFLKADLTSNVGLPTFGQGFDYIVHAASYAQPQRYLTDPVATMKLSSSVTCDLLEMAARSNDTRGRRATFLFLSSVAIYGVPQRAGELINEDFPGFASPLDPRAVYTSSKRFGETLCKVFNDQGSVDARIARAAPVFGPGLPLNDSRVLGEFVARALEHGELRMKDDGSQKRSWLFISDAMIMLFHVLLHGKHLVYNVSGTDVRSIAEMARYIAGETGVPVTVPETAVTGLHSHGAFPVIDLDISRIMAETGLGELVSLKTGLRSCIEWARSLRKGDYD